MPGRARLVARAVALVAALTAAGCPSVVGTSTDGAQLFEAVCGRCHGLDGRGDPVERTRLGVPDMTDPAWQDALTDEGIARTVRRGSPSRRMPAFGDAFSDEQLRAVIAHVRSLRRR